MSNKLEQLRIDREREKYRKDRKPNQHLLDSLDMQIDKEIAKMQKGRFVDLESAANDEEESEET